MSLVNVFFCQLHVVHVQLYIMLYVCVCICTCILNALLTVSFVSLVSLLSIQNNNSYYCPKSLLTNTDTQLVLCTPIYHHHHLSPLDNYLQTHHWWLTVSLKPAFGSTDVLFVHVTHSIPGMNIAKHGGVCSGLGGYQVWYKSESQGTTQ